MITKDQLADACRAMDNLADAGESFADILDRRGIISTNDALYVAQQRALRIILLLRPHGKVPISLEPTQVKLNRAEHTLYMQLVMAWIDGLAVGLKVSEP